MDETEKTITVSRPDNPPSPPVASRAVGEISSIPILSRPHASPRRQSATSLALALAATLLASLTGCGGGSSGSSNPVTPPVTPTPDMGTLTAVSDSYQFKLKNAASGLVLGIATQSQTAA
jgi:hypothetical protein